MIFAYLLGNPNITITGIILLATCVWSYVAEENPHRKIKWLMNPGWIARRKEYHRFLTSGFIHDGYMHLVFNMIALYSFGLNVEGVFLDNYGEFGALIFLIFYLSAMVFADLPDYFKYRHTDLYNALGASGAVSAVVFASILYNPLNGVFLFLIPIPIPGFIFAALYLFYSDYMAKHGNDNIGHTAHFYGSIYGIAFCVLLDPQVVVLFFRQIMEWRGFF